MQSVSNVHMSKFFISGLEITFGQTNAFSVADIFQSLSAG
jgi:hypothetical protein